MSDRYVGEEIEAGDLPSSQATDAEVSTAVSAHASLTSAHGATDANTASRIVARDALGNFSAGTITAAISGNVTGTASGNLTSFQGRSAQEAVLTKADVTGTGLAAADVGADPTGAAAAAVAAHEADVTNVHAHSSLSGIGTRTHAQIDSALDTLEGAASFAPTIETAVGATTTTETTVTHPAVTTGRAIWTAARKDSFVRLLINADTSAVDESVYARTLTLSGNAGRSTTQAAFGSGSIGFDGTNDEMKVSLTDVLGSGLAAQSWSVEFRAYWNTTALDQALFTWTSDYASAVQAVYLRNNAGTLGIYNSSDGGSWSELSAGAVSATTWTHIATVYDAVNDTLVVYVNGSATRTISSVTAFKAACTQLHFGCFGASSQDFNGYLDGIKVRIERPGALPIYTGNFTPAGTAPTDDGQFWAPVPVNSPDLAPTSGVVVYQPTSTTSVFRPVSGTRDYTYSVTPLV